MAKLIDIIGKVLSGEWGTNDETGDGIPVLRTTNFTNEGVVNYNDVVTRMITKKNIEEKYLRKGDIIIEKSGGSDKFPVGRVIYFDGEDNTYLFNNFTGLLRVKDREIWYPKYVFYSLFANYKRGGTRAFENKTTGLHNLKIDDYVSRYEVAEIGLTEQVLICDKLDKLYEIIKSREQELQLLDELIKARFVELFGNLDINDKGWNECSLGETCDKVIRYPTFYGMECLETGTRVIRIGNILEDGHMELADENYVFVYDGVNEDFPETVMELNDIVMAVRGDGSAAKRIGIIREEELIDSNISPNLIRIKAGKELEPLFLFYYLTGDVGQRRLDTYVNKTAKKNIAAKDIVKVIVPIPPLLVQKQFADFVNQVDKSKVAVQKALDETQTLFDSLMQEYFG